MARRVSLTKRDLRILAELATRRSESLDHLHATFFPDSRRKTALNRLRDLERAGFLVREEVETIESGGDLIGAYTLGRKGKAALIRRSLAQELFDGRRFSATLRETSIPHQIATNRVGDWLGARLIPEHLLPAPAPGAQRHRPDAVYRAAMPDSAGRQLVFLEVDLGNYSRQRILGKIDAFLGHPDARSILIVCEHEERCALVSRWIREQHGEDLMSRVQPLTFRQIREGSWLDPGTEPEAR